MIRNHPLVNHMSFRASAARLILLGAAGMLVSNLSALPAGYNQRELVTGMDAVSAAVLPDGRVLTVEKFGLVQLVKNGVKQSAPFLNWEANTNSRFEKGMMAIIADPAFLTNGYIYVWYTDKRQGNNGQNRVSRFTVKGDAVDTQSEKLMISLGDAGANYHHGGGLAIADGKLFIASGCRGGINDAPPGPSNAADKNRVEGKILRINLDGTIPTDNPFYAANTGDARAVYYYGLRQPFTMSWNDKLKVLWFSEVQGSSSNDRVHEGGPAGTDYGFQNRGGKAPLWTAGGANAQGRAMIGSLWYTGTQFSQEWRDMYYFGNVQSGTLWAYDKNHTGAPKKFGDFNCPIDVQMDAVGAMYVTTRCQTEDYRYETGKLTKVWYGNEPTVSISPEQRSSIDAARRMNWSALGGRILVDLEQDGVQSVELRGLDGKVLAATRASGKGPVELGYTAKGAHLLVWKSGKEQAVTKVIL
jgi:glucose/arabinose dehydrogenase